MCGVITCVDQCALRARSTHHVHHAIVGVNVVIGVLVVHCELHVFVRVDPVVVGDVVVLVCDAAVVRRTLGLIALVVICCFRRSHFSYNFAVREIYSSQTQARSHLSLSLSAALKSPCTSKYRILHCPVRCIPQHAYCPERAPVRVSWRRNGTQSRCAVAPL